MDFFEEIDFNKSGSDNGIVEKNINKFFDKASLYVPNKFHVILFGQYVESAIYKMQSDIKTNSQTQLKQIQQKDFGAWLERHYKHENNEHYLSLLWTCKDVKIPTVNATFEEGYTIDTVKNINYPLIKEPVKVQDMPLTIVEDRKLMMYQFFNALTNQFYNAHALKPNSSFQKLSLVVTGITQAENLNPNSDNKTGIFAIPGQTWEFNSAVLSKMDSINLDHAASKELTYNVTFKVPNLFQKSFNNTLSGLRDNTTDHAAIDPNSGMDNQNAFKDGDYNKDFFEQEVATLATKYKPTFKFNFF